jgi:ABC-type multidrug transport system fused ATPase/permease subunit
MPQAPNVPVTVWEQIPVVVLFALLLFATVIGPVWFIARAFTKAIADINKYYAEIIQSNNSQWQAYFDARSESSRMLNTQLAERLDNVATILKKLVHDFELHDEMEKQLFDLLSGETKSTVKRTRKKDPNP